MKDFYKEKNEVKDARIEKTSPGNRYRLTVRYFRTGTGTWNVCQGDVYRNRDNALLATVKRNYSSFPYLFIEDHPMGDFLVCGEDYQGQTVVELGTGKVVNNLSTGSDKGHGFCWGGYRYDKDSQILVISGCHWACPYEYRFFDFSNPMTGWPEIVADCMNDEDARVPEISGGVIRCFGTRYQEESEDDKTDEPKEPGPIDTIRTFKREGLKLVLVSEWKSDDLIKAEEAGKIARGKYEEWLANFCATDPLYLEFQRQLKGRGLSPDGYYGIGITYEGWCPDFLVKESRYTQRIIARKGLRGATVDLEWGMESGPIKVVFWKNGNSDGHKFFEHSVSGMREAFRCAREY